MEPVATVSMAGWKMNVEYMHLTNLIKTYCVFVDLELVMYTVIILG